MSATCSLKDILGIIVSEKDMKEVTLEFRSWRATQYFLDDRDDFVASVTDLIGIGKGTEFSIRLESFFSHTLPEKPHPAYQVTFVYLQKTVFLYYL
jgi:DnaJ family protein C protein 13